jgi:hypothetical protein
MLRYNSYRSYLRNRFGGPVLKISLDAGFSCPNRDGGTGAPGCSYCDVRSFSPVAGSVESTKAQLLRGIERGRKRYRHFIAYLQPYTNTYAPVNRLRSLYESLIDGPDVVGLAIGTRPDCIDDDVFELLCELSSKTFLSVELGLQSGNDGTLERNRRGHTVECFTRMASRLAAAGIEVVAHVILGLPGDSRKMMLDTARLLASLPVQGVKFHQLMIVRGTQMHAWHERGEVQALKLEEYAELVGRCLALLRPDQHIHRLVADSRPDQGLVAPLWSADKTSAIAAVRAYLEREDVCQGKEYGGGDERARERG